MAEKALDPGNKNAIEDEDMPRGRWGWTDERLKMRRTGGGRGEDKCFDRGLDDGHHRTKLVEEAEEGLNRGSEKEYVTHDLDVRREYPVRERS